jgi:pilus assembly protein Flp/PilA
VRRYPEGESVTKRILEVLRSLHNDESGQDLIEYALVAALIAFGAVAAMNSLSVTINSAFSVIGSKLSSAVS